MTVRPETITAPATSTDRTRRPASRLRRLLLGLAVVALLGVGLQVPAPAATAHKIWWAPNPPSCHTDNRWIGVTSNGRYSMYRYDYAFRYTTRSASSQGIVYYTHYVYDVQNVFYPAGMVTVGRADKICGWRRV